MTLPQWLRQLEWSEIRSWGSVIITGILAAYTILYTRFTGKQTDLADKLNKLTEAGHQATFDQWLAVNKPFVRVTFHNLWKDPKDGVLKDSVRDQKANVIICFENLGHLPLWGLECRIDKSSEPIDGESRTISESTFETFSFMKGAVIAAHEYQIFHSEQLRDAILAHQGSERIEFNIQYEFEPNMRAELIFHAQKQYGKEEPVGREWIYLAPIESTRVYRDWKKPSTKKSPG